MQKGHRVRGARTPGGGDRRATQFHDILYYYIIIVSLNASKSSKRIRNTKGLLVDQNIYYTGGPSPPLGQQEHMSRTSNSYSGSYWSAGDSDWLAGDIVEPERPGSVSCLNLVLDNCPCRDCIQRQDYETFNMGRGDGIFIRTSGGLIYNRIVRPGATVFGLAPTSKGSGIGSSNHFLTKHWCQY